MARECPPDAEPSPRRPGGREPRRGGLLGLSRGPALWDARPLARTPPASHPRRTRVGVEPTPPGKLCDKTFRGVRSGPRNPLGHGKHFWPRPRGTPHGPLWPRAACGGHGREPRAGGGRGRRQGEAGGTRGPSVTAGAPGSWVLNRAEATWAQAPVVTRRPQPSGEFPKLRSSVGH